MKIGDVFRDFDFDLPLRDALEGRDPFDGSELSVSRRVLAGAVIGKKLEDLCFTVSDLTEALSCLQRDYYQGEKHGERLLMMEEIIAAGHPLAMRLWFLVRDLHIAQAVADLAWLKAVAGSRAKMFKAAARGEVVPYYDEAMLIEAPTAAALLESVPSAFR